MLLGGLEEAWKGGEKGGVVDFRLSFVDVVVAVVAEKGFRRERA